MLPALSSKLDTIPILLVNRSNSGDISLKTGKANQGDSGSVLFESGPVSSGEGGEWTRSV